MYIAGGQQHNGSTLYSILLKSSTTNSVHKKKNYHPLLYNLFNAFFLSFFFFSAPLTVLAKDLSLNGRFFPAEVELLEVSLVASEPSAQQLSAVTVLELSPVVDEKDEAAADLGGLAWISVIIRAWLE